MQIEVELYGADNVLHAKGVIDSDKIADTHLVKRGGAVYAYQSSPRWPINPVKFVECVKTYDITEF